MYRSLLCWTLITVESTWTPNHNLSASYEGFQSRGSNISLRPKLILLFRIVHACANFAYKGLTLSTLTRLCHTNHSQHQSLSHIHWHSPSSEVPRDHFHGQQPFVHVLWNTDWDSHHHKRPRLAAPPVRTGQMTFNSIMECTSSPMSFLCWRYWASHSSNNIIINTRTVIRYDWTSSTKQTVWLNNCTE